MTFNNIMPVLVLLVFLALLVLAIRRPHTRQPFIIAGLVMSIVGVIPDLPKVSTALMRAMPPWPDPAGGNRSVIAYRLFYGAVWVVQLVGTGLFGWGALTSRPRERGSGSSASAPWGQPGGQSVPWTPSGRPGAPVNQWTPNQWSQSNQTPQSNQWSPPNHSQPNQWSPPNQSQPNQWSQLDRQTPSDQWPQPSRPPQPNWGEPQPNWGDRSSRPAGNPGETAGPGSWTPDRQH